jgi:eukaryotic-like serine/threonine-protein kinase
MRLAPGQAVGRYDVVDLLGEGGMSESYRARDRETGQTVVLKVPYANIIGDPSTYSRYERETEIGRRLVHPNIQRLLDTGRLEDTVAPYIVWEYVDGESLRQYLSEHAPLPTDEAMDLAHQLASAVDACHQQGIVHRDLKPENVLITPEHQLKLLDFGIALLQGARRLTWSRLSNTVGTPDYMAPEQIRGERGDRRTDIYALGMMLFEMLAGKVAYEGDNALSIMNQHVNQEAPRVKSKRSDVPQQLDAIVAKAIRRNPHERYESVAELLHDLDHWHDVDTTSYIWVDQAPVGPMPSAIKAVTLVVAVFAALAILGVLAQMAHGH